MSQRIRTAVLTAGIAWCSGCAVSDDPADPPVAEASAAVTQQEYCQTLAFIIQNNWDRATGQERAAMSAAWGTNCSPQP